MCRLEPSLSVWSRFKRTWRFKKYQWACAPNLESRWALSCVWTFPQETEEGEPATMAENGLQFVSVGTAVEFGKSFVVYFFGPESIWTGHGAEAREENKLSKIRPKCRWQAARQAIAQLTAEYVEADNAVAEAFFCGTHAPAFSSTRLSSLCVPASKNYRGLQSASYACCSCIAGCQSRSINVALR